MDPEDIILSEIRQCSTSYMVSKNKIQNDFIKNKLVLGWGEWAQGDQRVL